MVESGGEEGGNPHIYIYKYIYGIPHPRPPPHQNVLSKKRKKWSFLKMVNSKQKGKTGELEFVNYLKSKGINARRGVQYQGGMDSPDVVSDLEGFHFEVKRSERINIYNALKQAEDDCGGTFRVPVVCHRQNRKKWIVALSANDFINLIKNNKT